jgi:hypothetical protein
LIEKSGAMEGQNQTLNKLEIYLHKIKEWSYLIFC